MNAIEITFELCHKQDMQSSRYYATIRLSSTHPTLNHLGLYQKTLPRQNTEIEFEKSRKRNQHQKHNIFF